MTELNNWILEKLKQNDWDTKLVYDLYGSDEAADMGANDMSVSGFERKVRKVKYRYGLLLDGKEQVWIPSPSPQTTFEEQGNEATVDLKSKSITSLAQLLEFAKVDLSIWRVDHYKLNNWEMGAVIDGKPTTQPLFQVTAWLVKITPDTPKIPVIQPLSLPRLNMVQEFPINPATHNHLVFGDAQIGFNRHMETGELQPYHDEAAMNVVLQILRMHTFRHIVILGDMLDMTEASKYTQQPEFHLTLQPAINYLGEFLFKVRKYAPNSTITYLSGNHEIRLQHRLVENFKFAYGLKAFNDTIPFYSLRRLLDLDAINISMIEEYPSGQWWLNDNLVVAHGEYLKLASESKVSNVSTITGHLHREETISKTIQLRDGYRQMKSVTCGCLCKIDGTVPGVVSRPNWQNGIVHVEEHGDVFNINHISIINGKATFNGLLYDGHLPPPFEMKVSQPFKVRPL